MSNLTLIRIVTVVLLAAAAAIGIMNPVFNGLSAVALGLVALAWYIGSRRVKRQADHA